MMDEERINRIIRVQRILERVEGYAAALGEIAKEELDDALFYEELVREESKLTLQMKDFAAALIVMQNSMKKKCVSLKKEIEKAIDGEEPFTLELSDKTKKHLLTYSEIVKKCPAAEQSDRMSGQEIARRYRTSADKKKQIKILAQLNDCTKAEIEKVLKAEGEAV